MKRGLIYLLLLLPLHGCGVLLPYMYDSQKLQDRLIVSMPKEDVLKNLGNPDRVVQDVGQLTIWEYRLYPKKEWAAYLMHCPVFPNCYFPAEPGNPYYVVLQDNQLCLWGTPEVVRPLIGIVCVPAARLDRKEQIRKGLRISVAPVFMPPVIAPQPQRLAVVPVNGSIDNEVNSWLDLTLNFLRTRHRDLVLVERQDLRSVLDEVGIQYGGMVDDDTTIRVGRLVGADSLLIYRLVLAEDRPKSAAFELRLFKIESGTTVFRQMTSVNQDILEALINRPYSNHEAPARRLLLEEATAYGLAALTAAFGDNPLGVVSDYSWSGKGIKVIDILQGGPGFRAGIKPGDQILESNHQPLGSWSDPISLPAHLTVRRDGMPFEMDVR
jgi:hypothetical protein